MEVPHDAPEPYSVGGSGETLAVVPLGFDPSRWTATIHSLRAAGVPVLLLSALAPVEAQRLYGQDDVTIKQWSLARSVTEPLVTAYRSLFIAVSPVVVPVEDPFGPALGHLDDDLRVATVSFFSNRADYLTFPRRNQPSPVIGNGHSELSITRALRRSRRAAEAVPVPVPTGGGVLVSVAALHAVGGIDPGCPSIELAMLDTAARATKRGFRHVLDSTTFIFRPAYADDPLEPLCNPGDRAWLEARHSFCLALYDEAKLSEVSPIGEIIALRRAELLGLRILIDGGCLGPYETGTQVAMLAQIEALAERSEVDSITVGIPGGSVPGYAQRVLSLPKVFVYFAQLEPTRPFDRFDIVHRPFQDVGVLPMERWAELARRSASTVHDLIAYDNGHYHATSKLWLEYRRALEAAARSIDLIVSSSEYTERMMLEARLPIDRERIRVVALGTDHLAAMADGERTPPDILAAGLTAAPLIVVLGASYVHKNRDVAIRAWQVLRDRGIEAHLVLAGVVVPYGSTVNEEAAAIGKGPWPLTLPEVTTEERNWLLRHADLVLYPTAAEGFGLVPFEAADFGTPCVFVGFGSLAELIPDPPLAVRDWDPAELADAMTRLMSDSELRAQQVDAVKTAGRQLTWSATARHLTELYFELLARPTTRQAHSTPGACD